MIKISKLLYCIAFTTIVMCWFTSGYCENSVKKNNCIDCHNKQGIYKVFENGERIEAIVNVDKYKRSAHKDLECTACHIEFESSHPKRRFRSYSQYKIMSNNICDSCHSDILNDKIHKNFIGSKDGSQFLLCTNCHSPHYTAKSGSPLNNTSDEKEYCLSCHKNEIQIEFLNGDKLSAKININELSSSVHKDLQCSDCHYGFSHDLHPRRTFENRRNLSIANADTCRRCHFDKYTMYEDSIHSKLLSKGDERVPLCTNCHGYHEIQEFGEERTKIARKCGKCHDEIYNIYAKSVHGAALFDEHNKDVPNCIDCHTSHEIKNPLTANFRLHIPELCGNCHVNEKIVGKYGLSTKVISTYIESFHGKKTALYLRENGKFDNLEKVATCVDCHGVHNIKSLRYIEEDVLKEKLVKRCRHCHKKASLNFPNAWLSHYIPTFYKTPVLFVIIWFYKFFIIILIVSIILQIFLSIWRYAVSR
ncbi:MAG: cytochrome c3 family protein [Deferribacterota bacterium]|nr:cytochrome c3 family protein [Deferribacterota bacterium]